MVSIRLLAQSRLTNANWCSRFRFLVNHVPSRLVQEFPGLRLDNSPPKDHIVILPESANQTVSNNELIRATSAGESQIDFSKLNPEVIFKGLSQSICSFENYITDINNGTVSVKKTINEIIKDMELKLYPMDVAYNILMILMKVDTKNYNHLEFEQLVKRYRKARELRYGKAVKEALTEAKNAKAASLSPTDDKILQIYRINERMKFGPRALDINSLSLFKQNLDDFVNEFKHNLNLANRSFSFTVDDPDILAALSNDSDGFMNTHHKERTPVQITIATYPKFMQSCPDRFVRKMLWQTCNKRCSPRGPPKQNNLSQIKHIRIQRKRISDLLDYRSHVDFKLDGTMAASKQRILDTLQTLNRENHPIMLDRLNELNDYAADNSFEDQDGLGIQDYDADFWSYKYIQDILIGKSVVSFRSNFKLKNVLDGLIGFFSYYLGIDLKLKPAKLWSDDVQFYEVSRNGCHIGNIIYDPYQRETKILTGFLYVPLKSKIQDRTGIKPAKVIMTSFKQDPNSGQVHLKISDTVAIYYIFASIIQSLLYNYKFYELNVHGANERDSLNLLPKLCVAHLLTDYRVIQSSSSIGGSKTLDAETASRILKGLTYFKSLSKWRELYRAHLDQDAHTLLSDIKPLSDEIYKIYSPYPRDPDDYDICSMSDMFVGPRDGIYYDGLWGDSLANFCLSQMTSGETNGRLDDAKAKEFYSKLIDSLFDPEKLDTNEKLFALTGERFEPTKASLGVL